MDIEKWIQRHLGLTVSADIIVILESLSEEELHDRLMLSDDAARMSLMCMDTALKNGWKMLTAWYFLSDARRFTIEPESDFCVTLDGVSTCFALNRYGQMQLHQWLQEHFRDVMIKGR